MNERKEQFEQYLKEYCKSVSEPLHYVLLSEGHRIRPLLTICWCELSGGTAEQALPYALAVELVHTMSLIHDDLPCMDNADMRRGRESLHKKFSEPIALLVGDELLARAFALVSDNPEAVKRLSRAARYMSEGQQIELTCECHDYQEWINIHRGKTASLMQTACVLGVMASKSDGQYICEASEYGFNLGMTYQIMDDIKDGDGIVTDIGEERARDMAYLYVNACSASVRDIYSEPAHILDTLAWTVMS